MRRAVLDASVLIGWFDGTGSADTRALRAEYEAGAMLLIAPGAALGALLDAARERLAPEELAAFASALENIGLEFRDPPTAGVAAWVARGLAAGEAAGPALAMAVDLPLFSVNSRVLRIAHTVARRPD